MKSGLPAMMNDRQGLPGFIELKKNASLFYQWILKLNFMWLKQDNVGDNYVFYLKAYPWNYTEVYPDMIQIWTLRSRWIPEGIKNRFESSVFFHDNTTDK